MSTSSHPEDLLDAWRDGSLDAAGRAQLDAHAVDCVACRLEMGLDAGLDDEIGPRAEDRTKMAAMIGVAMVDVPQAPTPASSGGSAGLSKLLGAGLLVAGGVVVALVLARGDAPSDDDVPTHDAPTVAAVDEGPVPEPAPEPSPPLEAPAVPTPEVAPTEPSPELEAPQPQVADATARKSAPVASAADLLRDANAKRRARDYAGAAALYGRLARRHRGSDEEVLSRVTYGRVLLEHLDRPGDALGRFDAYLASRPSGTLAEEALVGRAKALGRLGRGKAERAAWAKVLERFPDSAYASMAREQIGD